MLEIQGKNELSKRRIYENLKTIIIQIRKEEVRLEKNMNSKKLRKIKIKRIKNLYIYQKY